MNLEVFSKGDSLLHTLDPRVKLIGAIAFSVIVGTCHDKATAVFALILGMISVTVACLEVKALVKRLFIINGFILFLWFFLPFTSEGDILFSVGHLNVFSEGVENALLITLKSNAIALICIGLLATSPIPLIIYTLSCMRFPMKLVQLFSFGYRYLHLLHLEFHRLENALKVRCFLPGTNLHTYRTFAYFLASLLLRSYDRSQRVYQAMLCRGFTGVYWMMDELVWRNSDTIGAIIILICIWGMAFLRWRTIFQ
ncbi:MAG: cobalt ECF transporter T component CbiQ [Pseudomonadota bacterium]